MAKKHAGIRRPAIGSKKGQQPPSGGKAQERAWQAEHWSHAAFVAWEAHSRHLRSMLFAAIWLISFAVYAWTLYPSVPGGDSGELIEVAHTFGVAHPPGYPVYTMMGKLFSLIPFGSVAWRLNFFSALCGSLAVALLFALIARWSRDIWAGLLAAGLFAFSPLIWRYSVQAEVFSLNILFCSAVLYFSLRFHEQPSELRWLYAASLLTGLGLSNHHALVFIAGPALAAGVVEAMLRRTLSFRSAAVCAALGLLGLLPYAYLPIASGRIPLVSWGDETQWSGFAMHFLRQEYGTFRLNPHAQTYGFLRGLWVYLKSVPSQSLFAAWLLSIAGVILSFRARRLFAIACLAAFLIYLTAIFSLSEMDLDDIYSLVQVHQRFWGPANLFIFIWAGLGFAAIRAKASRPGRGLLAVLAAAAMALQLGMHYRREDQSANRIIYQFGKTILDGLPEGTLLLTRGDIYLNTLRYLQGSEGIRPDVRHLDLEVQRAAWSARINKKYFTDVVIPGQFQGTSAEKSFGRAGLVPYTLVQLIDANYNRFPIFVALSDAELNAKDFAAKYDAVQHGFVKRLVRRTAAQDFAQRLLDEHARAMQGFDRSIFGRFEPGSWENIVWNEYWKCEELFGWNLASAAIQDKEDVAGLIATAAFLEGFVRASPSPPLYVKKNLGLIYYNMRATDPSVIPRIRQLWEDYLSGKPTDPEIPAIKKRLEELP